MNRKKVLMQAGVCLFILMAAAGFGSISERTSAGAGGGEDKFGSFLEKVAEAVRENYTLAELLQIGEEVSSQLTSIPQRVSEAVIAVNEDGLYGEAVDQTDSAMSEEDLLLPVYAVAGGRVLRCGLETGLGLYVTIEHPDSSYGKGKISTYGQLSDIKVVSGDRIRKGDMIGSYDSSSEKEFYYSLEEKS